MKGSKEYEALHEAACPAGVRSSRPKVDDADDALRAARQIVTELGELDIGDDPSNSALRLIRNRARSIAQWAAEDLKRAEGRRTREVLLDGMRKARGGKLPSEEDAVQSCPPDADGPRGRGTT